MTHVQLTAVAIVGATIFATATWAATEDVPPNWLAGGAASNWPAPFCSYVSNRSAHAAHFA